jgi:hypothetical protein
VFVEFTETPFCVKYNANFGACDQAHRAEALRGKQRKEAMYNSQLRDKVSSEGFHDGE